MKERVGGKKQWRGVSMRGMWSWSWTGNVGGKERECGYMNCGSWRVNVSANMALHFYTSFYTF